MPPAPVRAVFTCGECRVICYPEGGASVEAFVKGPGWVVAIEDDDSRGSFWTHPDTIACRAAGRAYREWAALDRAGTGDYLERVPRATLLLIIGWLVSLLGGRVAMRRHEQGNDGGFHLRSTLSADRGTLEITSSMVAKRPPGVKEVKG